VSIYKSNSLFQQLELSLLKHFFAIATFGGFSKASRASGISQPALSLGLQKLEKTLGTSLVDRESRDFKLTDAGAKLLRFCQRIETALDSVVNEIGSRGVSSRPRFRIGTALSIGFTPLLEVCAANSRDHDPFELEISAQNTYQLLDEINDGTMDLALVPGDVYDSRVNFNELSEQALILVAGEKTPPSALKERTLLTYPRETPMRSLVDKICIQNRLEFKSVVSANSLDAIKMLVVQNIGCAFVLKSLVRAEIKKKELVEVKLPFVLPSQVITYAVATGTRGTEMAERFRSLMKGTHA
jgi:DNA-binding transcriptional LysR family regulator